MFGRLRRYVRKTRCWNKVRRLESIIADNTGLLMYTQGEDGIYEVTNDNPQV